VDLAGAYGASGSRVYTSEASFSVNGATLHSGELEAGFLTTLSSGTGSLQLVVKENSTTIYDETYATLAAAQPFFTDDVKNIAAITSGSDFTVSFELYLTTSTAGAAFDTHFIFGLVPEPSSAALLLLSSGLLASARLHRRATAKGTP
jgi:hypothetical protein